MKPVSGKKMARALGRKGWTLIRSSGSHRTYKSPDGVLVTVPYHAKDLKRGTQRSIMKAAGLTDDDL